MRFSKLKWGLKTSINSTWNEFTDGNLHLFRIRVTKNVTWLVFIQFIAIFNSSWSLADSSYCERELLFSPSKQAISQISNPKTHPTTKPTTTPNSSSSFSEEEFSNQGAIVFNPPINIQTQDLMELYKLSLLWDDDNFIIYSLSDLYESGIPETLIKELTALASNVATQIDNIDSSLKYGKFKKQFKGKSVRLTKIWIKNEKSRPINKNGKFKDRDGHVHHIGWVTGSISLMGPGSWLEIQGQKVSTSTGEMSLFSSTKRSRKYESRFPGTRHGTPELDIQTPRLLILFEFEFSKENSF